MCTPAHLWETSERRICDSFLYHLPDKSKILDVGCGTGFALDYMRQSHWVTGCDRNNGVDASVSLPYETDTFNGVWFAHVMEHLRNPATALLEISRVCMIGGLVVILVPNDTTCRPGHIWSFPPDHLIYLLARCGFDCRDSKIITHGYSIATFVVNRRNGFIDDEQFNDSVLLPRNFPNVDRIIW